MVEIDGPKHEKLIYLKLHCLKIPMANAEYYEMHDDTDDGLRVQELQKPFVLSRSFLYWFKDVHIDYCSCESVTVQCHTVHRGFFVSASLGKQIFCINFQAIYLEHFIHDLHEKGVT